MNRCLSCNEILDIDERKFVFEFGENIQLCKKCLDETNLDTIVIDTTSGEYDGEEER